MSEFKGTPGPWSVGEAPNGNWIEYKNVGKTVSIGRTFYEDTGAIIEDANARLIAAAPDLLEALDWAIAEIEGRTRYEPNDIYEAEDQRENALDCARAAIAKALGQ